MLRAFIRGPVFSQSLWFCLLLALTGSLARADRQVVVRATAGKKYVADKTWTRTEDPNAVETYVFMPGRYFEPGVGDDSLQDMPFNRIAETLAGDLVQQGFRPATGLKEADLILVVHWGMTARVMPDYELYPGTLEALYNTQIQFNAAVDSAIAAGQNPQAASEVIALQGELGFQKLQLKNDQLSRDLAAASTAELLGLRPRTKKEHQNRTDERRRTLIAMEQEDRYFILVMAYDCRALLQEGKFQRLWTSRMSMRSAGVNFPIALTRMSLAAGPTFGSEPANLVIKRVRDRETAIEIGEPVVVVSLADAIEATPP